MAVLLTYDVDSKHVEIKNRLIANYGYVKTLTGTQLETGKVAESDLPNTTVYHATKMPQDAASDIIAVAAAFSAVLEKYTAFEVVPNSWRGETSRLV